MILLVIDMQKGLVDEDLYDYENFLNRTVGLVDAARPPSATTTRMSGKRSPTALRSMKRWRCCVNEGCLGRKAGRPVRTAAEV